MIITIGTTTLDVELYDNHASRSLRKTLPQEIRMSSWGDEYYGELARRIDHLGQAKKIPGRTVERAVYRPIHPGQKPR